VFLDSDTVVKPDWLKNLLESYYLHGEGLYQGKILEKDKPDIIGTCGNLINIFGFGFARGNGEKDTGKYEKFESISFPVGACMFSSLNTIKKIGHFDESNLLFLMLDDVDYAWKALTLGVSSYYEPKSIIYHPKSTSSKLNSQKMFFYERNRWICLLSYYSNYTLLKIFPLLIILELGLFFFFLMKGKGNIKIKAFYSLLKMYPEIKIRKKKLSKTKKLNDNEIITHFVNEINIPESIIDKKLSNFFNNFIKFLSTTARSIINL